jgi:O-antigen/teichoic acid export membrane protein
VSDADRSTVFWVSVGAGAVFTLAGIGASGLLADFYGEPEVRALFAVLSLSFFVTALGTTHAALLTREMNFRALELCVMGSTLFGAGLGIAVALQGYGAWAIIAQQLATSAVWAALLWCVSPWRPRLSISPASLRNLGGFSANVFAHRLLYYLHRNTANLLIGRFLGATPLGIYALAYNVILVPFSRIAGPIQEVLFPAFSRMQDDRARVTTVWLRTTRLVGMLSIPALAGLIIVAPDFVTVVLGSEWNKATPVIQVLAWVGLLQSLQTLNTDILQALDRTGTVLRFSILFYSAHFAAFVVGLQWGILGVAVGYAVSSTIVEPVYTQLTARALGTSIWAFSRNLSGVVQATLVMVSFVLLAQLMLGLVDSGAPAAARLVLLVLLGVAVYVPACVWRAPEIVSDLRSLRRGRARVAG